MAEMLITEMTQGRRRASNPLDLDLDRLEPSSELAHGEPRTVGAVHDALFGAVTRLNDELSVLVDRLSPVLAPTDTGLASGPVPPNHDSSEESILLRSSLSLLREVEAATRRVVELRGLVQL